MLRQRIGAGEERVQGQFVVPARLCQRGVDNPSPRLATFGYKGYTTVTPMLPLKISIFS